MPRPCQARVEAGFSFLLHSSMPTVLLIFGWRFFFYANEGNEPIHIHCKKGDGEAKYWIEPAVELARCHGLSEHQLARVRKLVEEHEDVIRTAWNKHFGG